LMEDIMKLRIAGITILLLIGTFSWGQGVKEPFDVKKSTEELEIMKGILNTTLTFSGQNSAKSASRWRVSNLSAFYLAGQGAVFVIPTSGLRFRADQDLFASVSFGPGPEFSEQMAMLGEEIGRQTSEIQLEAAEAAQQALELSYRASKQEAAPAPPAPPAPPVPPAPPSAPAIAPKAGSSAKVEIEHEKLKKAIEAAKARVQKAREEASATRDKFLQNLAEAKTSLVDALANYGDSMTTVKPEEFINLVLVTNGFDDQKTRSDVISARKSWITDYKAGRLNLEGFRQKVVQYNQ
jgi:hypothetical protein